MTDTGVGALHRLAPGHRAATPEEVATSMIALHSSDPAAVHLAVAARTAGGGASVDDIDRALYDDRTIVRVMGMRRTLWAVPVDLVPVVAAACGRAIAADERRKLVAAVEHQGLAKDGRRFVSRLEKQLCETLAQRGEAMTRELTVDVPALKATLRIGGNSKWATDVSLSSRIVLLLTCEGRIVRARPTGTWTSTQHRYALAPPAGEPMDTADAQAELARLWLRTFGAASVDPIRDLKWWSGWTVATTKRALAAAAGDGHRPPPVERADGHGDGAGAWAALVPGLDPTTMGWKERSWYLADLGPLLFDRNGNAGPAIWFSGRVVGGWTQRASGEVVYRLLVDIGTEGTSLVEVEAARLQGWLDNSGARFKPRFPTLLQKELSA